MTHRFIGSSTFSIPSWRQFTVASSDVGESAPNGLPPCGVVNPAGCVSVSVVVPAASGSNCNCPPAVWMMQYSPAASVSGQQSQREQPLPAVERQD